MVEPQIVVLVVAGSSPVGHPPLQIQISGLKLAGNPSIPKAKIPPYKTFNLSGDLYLTKRLRLIGGISNLTDEKYYDRVFANGIEPAPRRSGYAGLSLAF